MRRAAASLALLLLILLVWWLRPSSSSSPDDVSPAASTASAARRRVASTSGSWRDVRCVLPVGAEGDEIVVVAAETKDATQTALLEDGAIDLVLPAEARLLLADVPAVGTVRLEVDAHGECVARADPRRVTVGFDVHLPSGAVPEHAQLFGCGLEGGYWIPTDPLTRLPAEPCELVAIAPDGQVSRTIALEPTDGMLVEIAFDWDDPAVLPMNVKQKGEELLVTWVYPGSSAEGLVSAGDFVLEVDGVSTRDFAQYEFFQRTAGPEGGSVTLRLARRVGGEAVVAVPRERREAP